MKVLVGLLVLVSLTGCRIDTGNRAESFDYRDSDFHVVCLHGHNYLLRASAKSYMAPKFDPITHLPEACDK